MFNNKPYRAVNREERFYCGLFAHALLTSPECRRQFSALVLDRLSIVLDPEQLEVYLEVAALRDYWNDLGDPRSYSSVTHGRRRDTIREILSMCSQDPNLIDDPDRADAFWTGGVGTKLWNPGHWSLKGLDKLGGEGSEKLKRVKWAFNAKPDMFLLSPTGAVVIEAKIESGEGRDAHSGYDQVEIQHLVIELWRRLIPCFSGTPIELATLKVKQDLPSAFTWGEVIPIITGSPAIDSFTRACLEDLDRRIH